MVQNKVYVIGVTPSGVSGLSPETAQLLHKADIVLGGKRLLDLFPSIKGRKVILGNDLAGITKIIKNSLGKELMVVLASGDPGFYGIAGYLSETLGKDKLEVIPNVSSMQLAFARIRESWDDAVLVSAHGRGVDPVIKTARFADKIGIFTDRENTPSAIAGALITNGISGFRAYVCQDIGTPEEKIINAGLPDMVKMDFSPLNVLVLIRDSETCATETFSIAPGIPDSHFCQRRPREGLITKQEVRAISLSKLRLTDNDVLWDIGAGTGAVSIEASFFIRNGRIYAIEKNKADIEIINRNIARFQPANVDVIQSFAPHGLEELPSPDAVFIGGSGGRMAEIIEFVSRRLKADGRIVINTISFENLRIATDALAAAGIICEISLVNVSRSTGILELTRLEALNPVFVISAAAVGKA